VVGGTSAADKKGGKRPARGTIAFGKVVSLTVKDGAGTLTIDARKSREDKTTVKKTFKITKDTKFGVGAGRGKKPTPVSPGKVADTFKKGTIVVVRFEKNGDDMIAKGVVKFTPRKPKNDTK
jgi:hypothetical protein